MRRGALLLDLDGTLVDTAPDLVGALNDLLAEQGRAPVDYDLGRSCASDGAAGLIALGFGIGSEDERLAALRQRFLQIYGQRLSRDSRLFSGFEEIFDTVSELGWVWGVVTNKPQQLAETLLRDLGLAARCSCLIGGDVLPRRKPFPDPLLHAATRLEVLPRRCLYVGDAPRDIEAGRAAGMITVAARYGYLADASEADRWGADWRIDRPAELAPLLLQLHGNSAVC